MNYIDTKNIVIIFYLTISFIIIEIPLVSGNKILKKQQKQAKNNKKIKEKIVLKYIYPKIPSAVWLTPSETWQPTKKLDREKPIVVIIPSYKNAQWYTYNLDSVFAQNYENYRVIYLDDCSPDGTGDLVEAFIKLRKQEDRVTLFKNKVRVGALANIYNAVHMSDTKSIIVTLDGDDWLAHCNVFQMLNEAYEDSNVWLTYGQFRQFSDDLIGFCEAFPKEIIDNNNYRSYKWITSHLRTFYAWLFKEIKIEDLMLNGKFFIMTWDLAFMLPMLEMSGGRFTFIQDVHYIYNITNVINDFKVDSNLQVKLEHIIRSMKPYNRINK